MANNNSSVTAIEQLLSLYSERIITWADSEFAAKNNIAGSGAVTKINLDGTVYTPVAGVLTMPSYPVVLIVNESDILSIVNKYDNN